MVASILLAIGKKLEVISVCVVELQMISPTLVAKRMAQMREEYFAYKAEGTLMEETDFDSFYQNASQRSHFAQDSRCQGKCNCSIFFIVKMDTQFNQLTLNHGRPHSTLPNRTTIQHAAPKTS